MTGNRLIYSMKRIKLNKRNPCCLVVCWILGCIDSYYIIWKRIRGANGKCILSIQHEINISIATFYEYMLNVLQCFALFNAHSTIIVSVQLKSACSLSRKLSINTNLNRLFQIRARTFYIHESLLNMNPFFMNRQIHFDISNEIIAVAEKYFIVCIMKTGSGRVQFQSFLLFLLISFIYLFFCNFILTFFFPVTVMSIY